jgi:hypothetical protein
MSDWNVYVENQVEVRPRCGYVRIVDGDSGSPEADQRTRLTGSCERSSMIQKCRCSKCRKRFEVRYRKHAGVWEVYEKIATAHRKLHPYCASKWGTVHIRAQVNG